MKTQNRNLFAKKLTQNFFKLSVLTLLLPAWAHADYGLKFIKTASSDWGGGIPNVSYTGNLSNIPIAKVAQRMYPSSVINYYLPYAVGTIFSDVKANFENPEGLFLLGPLVIHLYGCDYSSCSERIYLEKLLKSYKEVADKIQQGKLIINGISPAGDEIYATFTLSSEEFNQILALPAGENSISFGMSLKLIGCDGNNLRDSQTEKDNLKFLINQMRSLRPKFYHSCDFSAKSISTLNAFAPKTTYNDEETYHNGQFNWLQETAQIKVRMTRSGKLILTSTLAHPKIMGVYLSGQKSSYENYSAHDKNDMLTEVSFEKKELILPDLISTLEFEQEEQSSYSEQEDHLKSISSATNNLVQTISTYSRILYQTRDAHVSAQKATIDNFFEKNKEQIDKDLKVIENELPLVSYIDQIGTLKTISSAYEIGAAIELEVSQNPESFYMDQLLRSRPKIDIDPSAEAKNAVGKPLVEQVPQKIPEHD